MPESSFVLYIGLRRPQLEWAAEIDAAAAQGYQVVVASDTDLAGTGLPDSRRIGFSSADPVVFSADRIEAGIDGVPAAALCWGDRHVPLAAELSRRWGLRGPDTAVAAVCTDKIAQRRALEPAGLNPRWRAGQSLGDLKQAVNDLGSPLVFKLAHSSGGKGTTIIDESTDLDSVMTRTSLNYIDSDAFLVEDLIVGTEHSVSGVVAADQVQILGVTDKLLPPNCFDTWATLTPSALERTAAEQIEQAARDAVAAVGISDGAFHVDLKFTADGPVVLEVGARLGGDTINSHLIPLASDGAVRPYDALLRVLVTGELPVPGVFSRAAAMVVLSPGERNCSEAVAHLLGHEAVRHAEDWSTATSPAVAAIVVAHDTTTLRAVVSDLGGWMR